MSAVNTYGQPFGDMSVNEVVMKKGDLLGHEINESGIDYFSADILLDGKVVMVGWLAKAPFDLKNVIKTVDGKVRIDLKKVLEIDSDVKGLPRKAAGPNIKFSKDLSFSTPNRLLILFDGIKPEIHQKEEEIRGPKTDAPEKALDGFLRSNNFQKKNLYQKENDKGVFYFAKKPPKIIKIYDLLNENIPLILDKVSWKKSMKWGDFELYWGRPLKSILAIFNNKNLTFKYHHLQSSNFTFIDKDFEDKTKIFNNFKIYIDYFKKSKIIVDQNKRKKLIETQLTKISKKKNLTVEINNRFQKRF